MNISMDGWIVTLKTSPELLNQTLTCKGLHNVCIADLISKLYIKAPKITVYILMIIIMVVTGMSLKVLHPLRKH